MQPKSAKNTQQTARNKIAQFAEQQLSNISSSASSLSTMQTLKADNADVEAMLPSDKMAFNPAMLKEQIQKCNIMDLYKNVPKKRHTSIAGAIADPLILNAQTKSEKWTYQLLVESKPLTTLVSEGIIQISYCLRGTVFKVFRTS